MAYKQNLHTHSVYCDGQNTLEELVQTAILKGFDSIGFSGHSHTSTGGCYCMSPEGTLEYKAEIRKLKVKYEDEIKIYCGIEYEMGSDVNLEDFDYIIGASHCMMLDGKSYDLDITVTQTQFIIDHYFGGNGLAFAKAYYEKMATLPNYGKFDILAHMDLITKFADVEKRLDITSKAYMDLVLSTAEALRGKIPLFEVNTGAIARGYRKTPYPAIPIIKALKDMGYGAVITSDCHNKDFLDCYFDESEELLRECGFREKYILTDNGFEPVSIL